MNYRKHALATSVALLALSATAHAQAPGDANANGNIIIVNGEHLTDGVIASKSSVPLIEQPQAISIVSQDMIAQQGITRLADALRNVAGVSRSSSYGFYDAYTIRGYDAAYGSVYLDGLINEAGVGFNQELSGLEQIEVLKGPASMLFGQAPLGGLINLVSKRPQADPFLNVTGSTGSYGLAEGTIDANAPLNGSGTVLARLNLAYRDVGSFVDNSGQNRIYVAPSLTWAPTGDTRLTLLARWQRDHDNPFSPVNAYGTVLPNIHGETSIHFSVNADGDQKVINNRERKQIGYIFDQKLTDAVSFSQTLRYTYRTETWDRWMFAAGFLDEALDTDGNPIPGTGRTLGRYYYGPYEGVDKDLAVDSRLTARFATAGIAHELLGGLDYRRNRSSYTSQGDYDASHNPLDLFDPDYSVPLVNESVPFSSTKRSHQTGVYLQDHLRFGDRFSLTLGGRYDWAEADGQKDDAFSPRIGLTAELIPGANFYASWSKSFTPQLSSQQVMGLNGDGSLIVGPLPPERGENYEVGLKFAQPEARLSGMISVFQLTRQNVATQDPDYLDYYIVTGEQRSRGVEVEAQWQPVPALTFNAAYAYIDAKITSDTTIPVGTPTNNVPRHNLNLFGRYVVQSGPLKDLGFNLGYLYNSHKSVYESTGLLNLPGYSIFDAGLSYAFAGWGAQLTVGNLFNKRYFPDACCTDRVTPGQPRNWRLTFSRSF